MLDIIEYLTLFINFAKIRIFSESQQYEQKALKRRGCLSTLQRYEFLANHNTSFPLFTSLRLFINFAKIRIFSESQLFYSIKIIVVGCLSTLQRYEFLANHNMYSISVASFSVVYQLCKDTNF